MALLVERQKHIDSDVVAALEFEWPEAPRWGSVELQQAVIDQTAQTIPGLEIKSDIPTAQVRRRLGAMAGTVLILGSLAVCFPGYFSSFLNRLLLGARHYPTRTKIEKLQINNAEVSLNGAGQEVRSPYGRAVHFTVIGKGALPESGSVDLIGEKGMKTSVTLLRSEENGIEDSQAYTGELSRLVDSAEIGLRLGDAWTEPIRLTLVPLPVIRLEIEVTPPAYARSAVEREEDVRQIMVAEGSRVVLRVLSDKALKEATLSIDSQPYPMVREGDSSAEASGDRKSWSPGFSRSEKEHPPEGGAPTDRWVLAQQSSPLDAVAEPMRYTIQVTDVNGLQLERPIEGTVRIKTDRPPQIAASADLVYVLPAAHPLIQFEADDDYGIARVTVRCEVIHADGKEEEKAETTVYELARGTAPSKLVRRECVFDLAPLGGARVSRSGFPWRFRLPRREDRGPLDRERADRLPGYRRAGHLRCPVRATPRDKRPLRQNDRPPDRRGRVQMNAARPCGIGLLLCLLAAATSPGQTLRNESLLRKQEVQNQVRLMAREVVSEILDVQLRQLQENGLDKTELFRDLQTMRGNVDGLVKAAMPRVVELLSEVQARPEAERGPAFRRAREKSREVLVQLLVQRQSVLKWLRMAEIAAQVRQVIEKETHVLRTTEAIPEKALPERESSTLATVEDQRNVKAMYSKVKDLLKEVAAWSGPAGSEASKGLKKLDSDKVDEAFDLSIRHLDETKYPDAATSEKSIIKALLALLETVERAQGLLNNSSDAEAAEKAIREIAERQKDVRKLNP